MSERPRAPSAILVSVGDELLLGETVDTNQAWLGRRLTSLGLSVEAACTVGDGEEEIRDAVSRAMGRARLVIVTGGLGPTPDDLTKEAVAALLGRRLELRQDLYDRLEAAFLAWGYDRLPPANRSQAQVPAGARCLENPRGSAPGILMHAGLGGPSAGSREGSIVVLLPGIPSEMEAIFDGDLVEALREELGTALRPTVHRTIHTTGVPESVLAERIPEALPADTGPVTLAFLPRRAGVDLRLSARGVESEDEAREWLDRIEEGLAPVVAPYRYESPRGDLVDSVADALLERRLHLSVAESCTGGLVAQRLTERPGASDYFLGGVVSYSNASKVRELGVPEALLERHGAVSEEVVAAMAKGVVERFGADAGLAVTGIAGPGGGSQEKPVGTVWYAVSVRGRIEARHTRFPGDREGVRHRSAQAALHLLLRTLDEG